MEISKEMMRITSTTRLKIVGGCHKFIAHSKLKDKGISFGILRIAVEFMFIGDDSITIRFFGTEDYWVLGTIELGHSENNIKLLGRWVTKSLTH